MTEFEVVKVAVDAPIDNLLSYRLPKNHNLSLGQRVSVPLGSRKSNGVIVDWDNEVRPDIKLKEISKSLEGPLLGLKTREWLNWLSRYYFYPPGQVYSMAYVALPNAKGKSRKKDPVPSRDTISTPFVPNKEQGQAISTIINAVRASAFKPFLLHGITGSGKTEVYLQAIQAVLERGQQALVLVPEISLTPQLLKRFTERFGDKVAVIHSHLTPREKSTQWWSVLNNEKPILVGARSALFCPLENIGVIIVDEEHDSSFKQDEQLKYSARDAAIKKAQLLGCPIVLGSATPSLETWNNCIQKKYELLSLPDRVEGRPLPKITLVDMRTSNNKDNTRLPYWMSEILYKQLSVTLESKEQSAVFLNRRGFAQYLFCEGCGKSEECPNCSVSLTAHRFGNHLLCHYCGFTKMTPPACSGCLTPLKQYGLGTERVVEDIKNLFPTANIVRADRDEINSRESLEELLGKLNSGEADIVVGTQMIAKGHDFPNLTFVGIVNADVGIHLPDFRASERTFQLLTQVSGRAGRHQKPGTVILQTYMPESYVVKCALTHNFIQFAEFELIERKKYGFPPFGRLAMIRLQGPDEAKVKNAADLVASFLKKISVDDIELLGPCQSPLAKLKSKFRYQIMIRAQNLKPLQIIINRLLTCGPEIVSSIKLQVDIDPLQNI